MNIEQSLFVLADASRCSGCRACELACFAAHLGEKPKTAGAVTQPVTPRLYLERGGAVCMPVQCHHCEDAPCMKSCLTGALRREEGVVFIDARKCIGCRNCALACPFGAVEIFTGRYGHGDGQAKDAVLVNKCDLCKDGTEPACAAACPNKALRIVDTASEINEKRIAAVSALPGGV